MENWQILSVGMFVLFGVMLNSTIGFGFGVIDIPLMVWVEVELPTALTITLCSVVYQCAWNSYQYRRHIRWP